MHVSFLSEELRKRTLEVFSSVKTERVPEKKVALIREYFQLLKNITDNQNLSFSIVALNHFAEEQMALHGVHTIDLYACFFSLKEKLRKGSTESLYAGGKKEKKYK